MHIKQAAKHTATAICAMAFLSHSAGAGTAVTVNAARTAFDAAKPDGYFWYRDKPKPKPEQKLPAPRQAVQDNTPVPMSSEWFRQTEQKLKDQMTQNPTEKTVFGYQVHNRMQMDRADEVARIWERNLKKYPFLSEDVRMPFSAMARRMALWQIDKAKEGIMADISKKAGLWMFFDSNCQHCHSQFETMKMFSQKYRNMEVRFISTDGGIIKGMPTGKVRFDRGAARARNLGIQITPAVVLVAPPDQMGIIAHGATSLSDLEEKIVTASIDMNIADPKLARTAKMNEQGMLNKSDLDAAGITGTENPEELAEKIYNIFGKKMGAK